MKSVKVAFVGCGNILGQYVKGCRAFEILDPVGCADIDEARAEARAAEFGLQPYSIPALLHDPDVEIVVNLTVPLVHAQVSLAVLRAGKHVHSEKPLATSRDEAVEVLAEADARGLLVGCAPDTFLGGGLQTCRKLLDDGWIGVPVAATGFFLGHGPEGWHPDPAFFYRRGGGPMMDMGPYYLTALVSLLGPVVRVTASARSSFPERVSPGPVRTGERFPVEVPTHIAGVMDFAGGVVGTLITSFDVYGHNLPRIEIYGSQGSLSVPDPNTFGGPVRLRRAGAEGWSEVPLTHNADVGRGIGVADLAYALRWGRPQRASGALAFHVLDLMQAFVEASETGRHVEISEVVERPAPLPLGLRQGTLDR